jgi:ABC-type lipoprotein release transport system permease subunit
LGESRSRDLVFAVDVSSFTREGFVGTTSFDGERVDIEFDEEDEGLYLTKKMCKRIGVRKGSRAQVIFETEDRPQVAETTVAGVRASPRVSNAKVYYGVGRGGGAIIRVRKA